PVCRPTRSWPPRRRCRAQAPRRSSAPQTGTARGWGYSRLQDRRAGGVAAFEIDMRLGRIFQCIGMIDRHMKLAVDHGGKQGIGALQQLLAGADIVVEL